MPLTISIQLLQTVSVFNGNILSFHHYDVTSYLHTKQKRPKISHLDCFVLQPQSIQSLDSFSSVLTSMIIHESIAQALACFTKICHFCQFVYIFSNTCDFVPDQFATFDFTNGGEKAPNFLLSHSLRQIIDNQIGFAVFIQIFVPVGTNWTVFRNNLAKILDVRE